MKKFFIFIFCFSFLIVGQSALAKMKSDVLNYIPQLNPTPKYFMTIYGKTNLNSGTVIFQAFYDTENTNCYKTVNRIEGVSSARQKVINYPFETSNNHYKIKIPIDYFLAGNCQWKLETITYLVNGKNSGFALISFEDSAKNRSNKINLPKIVYIKCNLANNSCEPTQNYMIPQIKRNNNYQQKFNFLINENVRGEK